MAENSGYKADGQHKVGSIQPLAPSHPHHGDLTAHETGIYPSVSPVHSVGEAKGAPALHFVQRVETQDTLAQDKDTAQRRRFFRQYRNPTDPSHYGMPAEYRKSEQSELPTIREYRRSRQRARIMLNSSSRLIITALLCGMCALVLKEYKKKGDLHTSDSQWLNALMTAIPLFIGLNYRSSLQSSARVLRWWVLARWDWELRQFDLILDAASSKAIAKLLWHSGRRSRSYIPTTTQLACLAWLVINVLGAIGIALLSLTYQVDQSQGVLMRNGNVSILDVSNETAWAESAYYYGSGATPTLLFPYAVLNQRTDYAGLNSSNGGTNPASCRNCTTWNYTFQDWDPLLNVQGPSDRFVSASASCKGYSILNYTASSITYSEETGGRNVSTVFNIPWVGQPWDANNTIWTSGLGASFVHDPTSDCGSRCARMYIISTQGWRQPPTWLYNCTNTVGQIGGKNSYAQLSDASARALAAASASHRNLTYGTWTNSAQYDWSNAWILSPPTSPETEQEMYVNDEVYAASSLAQFSLSAMANIDHVEGLQEWLPPGVPTRVGIRRLVYGEQPYHALQLVVNWKYAIALLCAVPALQLLVLLTIIFFANDVVVKDESHLNTARLFAPIAQKMSHRGSLLQIDEVIDRFGDGNARYRYGWEVLAGILRVGVLEKMTGLGTSREERRFPEGHYD